MDKLIQEMKVTLASTFTFYLKAHGFHWNVEGPNFPQYHEFFGELYAELNTAVDGLAEHVRQLDAYAPAAHRMLMELTKIQDDNTVPADAEMLKKLLSDNDVVLEGLLLCYMTAEETKEIALANFLQDRIEAHTKHRWMLKATTK
jgi:starvation-inducible DNA-binding protein